MKAQNKVVPLFQSEALIEIRHEQIGEDVVECVSARELYLKLGHTYEKWVRWYRKNIINNEWFIENRDWVSLPEVASSGQKTTDFLVTVDFAKHIAMMAKTQKGHEYRNYLINCEKRLIHSQHAQLESAQQRLKHSIPLNLNCPKAILGITKNSIIHDLYRLMELNGHARRREETKTIYRWEITLEGVDAYGGYNSLSGIRFSQEYHDSLKELLKQSLHADQDDLFMENN
jgi:phage anti-repressor protein